jgi:uncharacterized protein
MSGNVVADIVRRIVEAVGPDRIIVFGSRARGDARPDSDFDVLVIKKSDEPRYRALYRCTWRWRTYPWKWR